ncbi:MAG: response regulator transcription factor [Ruminococcus sp.]|nr:response regulator transcription factor [Ruminococcus sp.]
MIRIAIVDDENNICSYVERCLLNLSKMHCISIEVDVFNSGEDLMKTIHELFYDVIFLDIKMQNLSGLDISKTIRNTMGNETTQIIYISGNTEYAIEVFDYDPFHFLPKPLNEEKIESVFLKLIRKLSLKSEAFTYKIGCNSVKVAIKDIIYFESDKRKIIIHYNNKEDEFYGSLENIAQQLGKHNFLQVHKSFLINCIHVRKCKYESLEMSNHMIIPIAQSKRKEVREKQLEFINNEEV